MPNGILVIDKPAGWTSMDVCAQWALSAHGDPRSDWTSSAEVNSACGKVLPKGKTLGRRKCAEPWRTGRLCHA